MASDMFLLRRASDCLLPDIQYIERVVDTVQAEIADAITAITILNMLFDQTGDCRASNRIKQEIVMILFRPIWKHVLRSDIWHYNHDDDDRDEEFGLHAPSHDDEVSCPAVLSVMRFGDCEPCEVLFRTAELPGNWCLPKGRPTLPIARIYVMWHAAQREQKHYVVVDAGSNMWCSSVQLPRAQYDTWIMKGPGSSLGRHGWGGTVELKNEGMRTLYQDAWRRWDASWFDNEDRCWRKLSGGVWQTNYLKFIQGDADVGDGNVVDERGDEIIMEVD
jgi:hypothetical protein